TAPAPPITSYPPAPPETSALSLHDALPISRHVADLELVAGGGAVGAAVVVAGALEEAGVGEEGDGLGDDAGGGAGQAAGVLGGRSEEHTSELQSRENLVCRLLLEKKKAGRR